MVSGGIIDSIVSSGDSGVLNSGMLLVVMFSIRFSSVVMFRFMFRCCRFEVVFC